MSTKTKNEICLALWRYYRSGKEALKSLAVDGEEILEGFVDCFRNEIYLGAKVEQKDAFNNAAVNTFSLSAMQSMVLKKVGHVLVKQRLQFKENAEQALKGMAGYVVMKTEWAGIKNEAGVGAEAKVRITKTDGMAEFSLEAENPWAHLMVGEPIWVTEPFISTGDNQGKAWHELTFDEQSLANKAGNEIRAASTFPKYLQKRRMVLDKVEINSDDRDAWLEMTFKNAPDFDRQTFEEDALKEELGIEGTTDDDEEAAETGAAHVDDSANQPVNPDSIETAAIDAADDSDPGPLEPPPEEKF